MGEWRECQLGDLVEILDSQRVPVREEDRPNGSVPYYGANGQQGWIDRALFDEPLILLAEDGGHFEEYAHRPIAYRIDGPSWVNNHAHVLRSSRGVDRDYFYWSLRNKDICRWIAGGTRSKLTRGEMEQITFSVPPLKEQQRIAEILDTVDEAVHATERVISKYEKLRAGISADLLSRRIRTVESRTAPSLDVTTSSTNTPSPLKSSKPNKTSPQPVARNTSKGWVMGEWPKVELGEVFHVQLGKMLGAGSQLGEQYPYLANRNVQWGRIVIDDLGTMNFTATERYRYRLQPGDLLVCEGGEVGRAALWSDELPECYFQNAIHRLRATPMVSPQFMRHYIEFAARFGQFRALTGQTSIGHLPRAHLVRWIIPLPPLKEQQRIAEILDTVDGNVRANRQKLAKLQKLRAGLAADLLSGRVRTVAV